DYELSLEDRIKHYGQKDHVRYYGKTDLINRLTKTGFKVDDIKAKSFMDPSQLELNKVSENDWMLICTK
ncbi:MAG: hypothetical protein MRY83_02085, partial [Flavobacteriales bacterium]|nr:hypothetical protein [Flavobacteriales bacterium]